MAKPVRRLPPRRRTDSRKGPRDRHWYFERRISMDTIVGLLGIAVVLGGPFVLWGRAMESAQVQTAGRVTLLESSAEQRTKFEKERDDGNKERQAAMSAKVDKLDDNVRTVQNALTELKITLSQLLVVKR